LENKSLDKLTQYRLAYIESYFDIIFNELLSESEKIYIGIKSRFCRFCGQSEPTVSFRNDAHAIPESIGNKRLILLEECDNCNTYFSNEFENSFDKYTKPIRTMFGIKGKEKVPSYKSKNKTVRLDVNLSKHEIKVKGNESEVFEPNISENHHLMTLHREPYKPLAVYKTLIKMILSILPHEELMGFESIIDWVRYNKDAESYIGPHFISQRFTPGPSFGPGLYVIIFR